MLIGSSTLTSPLTRYGTHFQKQTSYTTGRLKSQLNSLFSKRSGLMRTIADTGAGSANKTAAPAASQVALAGRRKRFLYGLCHDVKLTILFRAFKGTEWVCNRFVIYIEISMIWGCVSYACVYVFERCFVCGVFGKRAVVFLLSVPRRSINWFRFGGALSVNILNKLN